MWAVMIPVAVFTELKSSVEFLVAISLIALLIGAIGAYQQAKAEIKVDKVIETVESSQSDENRTK